MSITLFILGREKELSLAELRAVYPEAQVQAQEQDFTVLVLRQEFAQSDLNQLGGVIKAARFLRAVPSERLNESLFQEISRHYTGAKFSYGLSLYGWSQHRLRDLLTDLKKKLKVADIKSRFANQGNQNISSAQFKDLRKKGLELVVAKHGQEFLIGEVVAVQDIDAYSKRDYAKPYRDMKVGMLPPKLAQILINLTGLREGTIWDPFCGGGTVIMEGLLMGYDMRGSDIDRRVLDGARENVEWLQQEFQTKGRIDLFQHDATKPIIGKNFDAIVCEGYLGPPQARPLSDMQLQPLMNELEKLYVDFFKVLHFIKFKGPIVIAMPLFRAAEGREVFLEDAIKKIKELGFRFQSFESGAPFLKYAREDQVVGRAIYRFIG